MSNQFNLKKKSPRSILIGKMKRPETNPALKNDPGLGPVLLRLKPDATLYFVRVTTNFNRTLLRLKKGARQRKYERPFHPPRVCCSNASTQHMSSPKRR
jgi:hypothetical protein